MFEKLTVKNYLLLKNVEIDFTRGFNVITGETGAGKSILIDALSLLMGERADYSIISKNKEKMVIEGLLKLTPNNLSQVYELLEKNDIENIGGENVIIRRELHSKGISRSFMNDTPVGLNVLAELGDIIIDIHSQNEHQSLLKKETHVELLDAYLTKINEKKFSGKLESYRQDFSKWLSVTSEYENIKQKKFDLDTKRNFIEFQLKEIQSINPVSGEDEELERELKTGENIEAIQQGLAAAYSHLYDDAGSALERLKIAEKELSKIGQFNSEIEKIKKDLTESSSVIGEAGRSLQALIENLSFDPEKVEKARERLYNLQFLKKKYGGSLKEALKLRETLENDLLLVDNFDEKISELEKKIKSEKETLFKKAKEISKARKELSPQLEEEVVNVLKEVGFENAGFKIDTKPLAEMSTNGIDDIEFLVKTNKGEDFSSLRKTASGGEVSRIMLSLKSVLAEADKAEILVFDEIDIGISGRVAQKVGKAMKKLSQNHQVIAITHLAQIAALAETHLLVEKEEDSGQTATKIRKLDKGEKVIEVARLLSGEKVTDASIKSAKELMTG